MAPHCPPSDIAVISHAKYPRPYVMAVLESFPKGFLFTLVSRLQDLSLSVVGRLFRASETFVKKGTQQRRRATWSLSAVPRRRVNFLYYLTELARAHPPQAA